MTDRMTEERLVAIERHNEHYLPCLDHPCRCTTHCSEPCEVELPSDPEWADLLRAERAALDGLRAMISCEEAPGVDCTKPNPPGGHAHRCLSCQLEELRTALERERKKVRVLREAVGFIKEVALAAERSEKRESQAALASIHGACQDALAATKETP